jgi:hypothetical protein
MIKSRFQTLEQLCRGLLGRLRYPEKLQRSLWNKNLRTKPHRALTNNIQITHLWFHWICIYLAHVPASIWLTNIFDSKLPNFLLRVRYRNPRILRDDVICNCENCLCVDAQPSHLQQMETFPVNKSFATKTLWLCQGKKEESRGEIDLWRRQPRPVSY